MNNITEILNVMVAVGDLVCFDKQDILAVKKERYDQR